MSCVKRMQRLESYRKLRRNKPDPNWAWTISTHIVCRTAEQKEKLKQLIENRARYIMKSEHTLIVHYSCPMY